MTCRASLSRLSDSVLAYYARAQSIICDESVSLQSLSNDLMSDLSPMRRLLYELRVSWEPSSDGTVPEANAVRTLVQGEQPRAAREGPGCVHGSEVHLPEPLAMFLPENQSDYIFTGAGYGKINGRTALMIDYRSRTARQGVLDAQGRLLLDPVARTDPRTRVGRRGDGGRAAAR